MAKEYNCFGNQSSILKQKSNEIKKKKKKGSKTKKDTTRRIRPCMMIAPSVMHTFHSARTHILKQYSAKDIDSNFF